MDMDEVRRLARDLASRREAAFADVQGEVDALKAELRRRATAIAEREQQLAELERRVNANGLAAELTAAQRLAAEAEAELRLAAAERERLDEREQQIRRVEKELAALRIELQERRTPPRRPSASARQRELDEREAALDAREAELDERERALRGETMSMPGQLGFVDGLAALSQRDTG